jgi:hypothetical protein
LESVETAREDLAAAEEAAAVVARAETATLVQVHPVAVAALPAVAELVAVESVEMELVGMPLAAASLLRAICSFRIARSWQILLLEAPAWVEMEPAETAILAAVVVLAAMAARRI